MWGANFERLKGRPRLLALGTLTPEVHSLLCTLRTSGSSILLSNQVDARARIEKRNNLAQLHIKRGEWGKARLRSAMSSLSSDSQVKELTDRILDSEPRNEKALYRRAQASVFEVVGDFGKLCSVARPFSPSRCGRSARRTWRWLREWLEVR